MGGSIQATAPRQWGYHSSLGVHLSEVGSRGGTHWRTAKVRGCQIRRSDHRYGTLLLRQGSNGGPPSSWSRRPDFRDSQHGKGYNLCRTQKRAEGFKTNLGLFWRGRRRDPFLAIYSCHKRERRNQPPQRNFSKRLIHL